MFISHLRSIRLDSIRLIRQQSRFKTTGKALAIRREDASIWERRAPLAPAHVQKLVRKGVKVFVQPSNRRAYPMQAYANAGAIIQEDIDEVPVIIGVKQVPIDQLIPKKTYAFFSHTIKAQEANMPLLDAILDRHIRLIDYEKMVDSDNQRVVAFGRYAGITGMINIMHGLGLRLLALGHHTPFMHIGPPHNYRDSGDARQAVRACGYEIALDMLPRSIGPIIFVFTGSGHVSQGAQEVFQELPFEYIDASQMESICHLGQTTKVYGVIASRSTHWIKENGGLFDPEEAQKHPDRYTSNFAKKIAPYATVIVNGIYWSPDSPRLLGVSDAKRILQSHNPDFLKTSVGSPALPHRLLAICDISADPGGSIEFMTECTTIDNPFCFYDAGHNESRNDFGGPGILVCSIDNMPTQLPFEATTSFGDLLTPYINDIIESDANEKFENFSGSDVVKRAIITSNGKLTPDFEYIMDLRAQKERFRVGFNLKATKEKRVLVLGSGFVAEPLVEMLTRNESNHVIVGSDLRNPNGLSTEKLRKFNAESVLIDVLRQTEDLDDLIERSDLVVSLLPYTMHTSIAKKCIQFKKNMITASYQSPEIKALNQAAIDANITILNEVGLDPGIDHLLAMECFQQVHSNGGEILTFKSFCGGLPAPENADNALLYKFSWNPRGVIMNSVFGAKWLENGEIREIPPGGQLMDSAIDIDFLKSFNLEGYPNRDSLIYRDVYGLKSVQTLLRGTLRYKGFCHLIKGFQMMDLLNTDVHPLLDPCGTDITWCDFIAHSLKQPSNVSRDTVKSMMFEKIGNDEERLKAFEDLGFFGNDVLAKKHTPFETLCFYLQNRLKYKQNEKDLVILRHEIGIKWPDQDGLEQRNIEMLVNGDPNGYSAMAKTVGYPVGIASMMLLNEEIVEKGIIGPYSINIYNPMIERLRIEGIQAVEKSIKL